MNDALAAVQHSSQLSFFETSIFYLHFVKTVFLCCANLQLMQFPINANSTLLSLFHIKNLPEVQGA